MPDFHRFVFGNGSEQISQNLQNKQEFWIYPAKVPGIWVWEITNESLMLVIDPVLLSQTAAEIGGLQENDMELMNTGNCHPQVEAIACLLQTKLNENPVTESLPQVLIIYPLPQHHEFPLPTPHSVGGLSNHRLKQVINYIHSHLTQPIQLAELSQICGMSQYYFCRLFKQSMGVTPYQYVLQQRMEKAKQLLRQRKYAIAEIALMVGCADQSHFTKHFKKYTGVTPRYFAENSCMATID
ncbi:AraC family transcriptional regulator [Nostoc sp. CENA543]|uniref:helix-turn-helix transcriptional regulator n=1 Tax=Nostoc sp. CENA543 TaxID=1869241 RepID=UPI000CA0C410|nr:AraC family transcriptional regulator [Nostoc sp. CENA543]AUT01878.1 AraC family transcriptional regulator [Nostoc sp. CENA543]